MAQNDLILIQNVHPSGVEFSEKYVNISKGGLLSANVSQVPTVLPAGTNLYILSRDDAEATGLKWIAVPVNHVQGTDTGTTAASFKLDSDGYKIDLVSESATKLGIKVDGDLTYADLQAKDATFAKVTVSAAPLAGSDLANKDYVDGIIAANDAMVFKGTIGTGGTHTIAAFNALATYHAGWSYRVIEAGTIKGVVCEIGDLVVSMVDRAGSGNVNVDWTVAQTNLDGAVIGPATAGDGYLALFDTTSGKLIKAGSGAPGSMAYANTGDYVAYALYDANSILAATADNTPAALTIGASTIVGRGAAGNISALTPAQAMNVLWVAAPTTKTSAGAAGMIAKDANFVYFCEQTGLDTFAIWTRVAKATNWT